MGRMSAAFARLSKREKTLVSVMLGVLVFAVVFLLNLWLSSSVSSLEAAVAEEQRSLREIYASATGYLEAREKFEAKRKRAEQSAELNLTELIAEMAQQVSLESVDARNNPTGRKRLEEYLDYAPPKDTPLARKRRGRDKDKRDPLEHYYRRDVEVTVRDNATFGAMYELMERIERSRDLLFVTEVRIDRNKRNPDRAGRGKIVVSTYFYEEKEGE